MKKIIELETNRLYLRQWQPADFEPFAALNADSEVMAFFPSPLARTESDTMAQRCLSLIAARGWGLWVVECKATGVFMGFVGLHIPSSSLPFAPCVEVGWRLARMYWDKGYATEGAQAALHVAFRRLNRKEVVSFTTVNNVRSRAVMLRLGMREAGLFDHPQVPAGSGLRQHCLFRLAGEDYDTQSHIPVKLRERALTA